VNVGGQGGQGGQGYKSLTNFLLYIRFFLKTSQIIFI